MIEIEKITKIDGKRHIALLDTSSISFMQGLHRQGVPSESVLKDYDLILIPEWVLTEINDALGRIRYVKDLIKQGYPIYCIEEEAYSDLANSEEGNLYQIVLASTRQLARIRSYLRRYVEKTDPLDMDAYKDWVNKLYDEWPISEEILSTGRVKKKNAGEVSITILVEIVSWYYPETKALTIYSQDSDTYDFQRKAEADLRKIFAMRMPVPVSYKSNDAILCQLVREGKISINNLDDYRKDVRKITYSKEQEYQVTLTVGEAEATQETSVEEADYVVCAPAKKNRLVVISSKTMGEGNDELGATLLKGFIYALTQQDELPDQMLFYNGGAFLTCEGSQSLEDLKMLEEQGVEIRTCGTCLNFYGISDKLQVGEVTNMYDIAERMTKADQIIKP